MRRTIGFVFGTLIIPVIILLSLKLFHFVGRSFGSFFYQPSTTPPWYDLVGLGFAVIATFVVSMVIVVFVVAESIVLGIKCSNWFSKN
jgi:ABC-type spermidine/putrescine transport system permease subunit II